METMRFETRSETETWEVARRFAETLESGDVVCLDGDLGSGKTTFTQGLCAAIGARRAAGADLYRPAPFSIARPRSRRGCAPLSAPGGRW